MDKTTHNQVSIDLDTVTLRFGEMEPVVIPRSALRTRLRLIDWIHRLTGWPGMNVRRLRTFIEAIYRHHGWGLSELEDDNFPLPNSQRGSESEVGMEAALPA